MESKIAKDRATLEGQLGAETAATDTHTTASRETVGTGACPSPGDTSAGANDQPADRIVTPADLAAYGLTARDVRRLWPWAVEYTDPDGRPYWLAEDLDWRGAP
jgi:hypothetical protein